MTKPTLADLEQLNAAMFAAYNAHDPAGVLALLTDDIEWVEPEGHYTGKNEVETSLQALFEAFPDAVWPTESVVLLPAADHQTMAVTWTWQGTQEGPYNGLPATGKKVDIDGVTVAKLHGTKIKELIFYFDTYAYLAQLGVVPELEGMGFKMLAMAEITLNKAKEALHV